MSITSLFKLSIVCCVAVVHLSTAEPAAEETENSYWVQNAQNHLKNSIQNEKIVKPVKKAVAKNVILFLGDGMSLATVAATRSYIGSESDSLSFEKFTHFGLSKTYCVDKQVADSACSSTAYLSGVKANYGTMGLSAKVQLNDCVGQRNVNYHTTSIATWAQDSGKATGLVTTAKLTDASPGGLYSHIANRYWQNDHEVTLAGCDPLKTLDIARQFVENDVSKHFKIALAGGRDEFRDQNQKDEEGQPGRRHDQRDLIQQWLDEHNQIGKAAYVSDKKGLQSIENGTDFVLGLFNYGHCDYNIDIERNETLQQTKPTLSEMTKVAVEHLQRQSDEGFFLFIEGARIDMAHHDNWAHIALDETKEFAKTIEMVRNMTNEEETLIVVTSDHSHTMTINGYAPRGSDILGLATSGDTLDGLPYTILSYANGLAYEDTYEPNGGRKNLSTIDLTEPRHRFMAAVPLESETHGGEDVGIYANGPQSHMFCGNYEQNYIPVLMAHAAKIGPFASAACLQSMSSILIVVSIMFSFFFVSA